MKIEKHQNLERLLASIEADREAFIAELRLAVHASIASQSTATCLTVMEVDGNGSPLVTWDPTPPGPNYVRALFFFCRGETFNGHNLDSPLTAKAVSVITDAFEKYYSSKSDAIANEVALSLVQNAAFSEAVLNRLLATTQGTVPAVVRSKAVSIIMAQMQDAFGGSLRDTIIHTVAPAAAKIVGAAVTTPVINILTMHLVKFIALHLKVVIAKILASAAFKAMVAAAAKKVVVVAVVAGLSKLVVAKLGVGAGAAVAFILVPLIVAFIGRELYILPDKMADEISDKVVNQIDGKFQDISRDVVDKIYENIASMSIHKIADEVASQSGVKEAIEELVANAA